MKRTIKLLILLAVALLAAGCAMTMKAQPKYEPLALSDFYPDGRSARNPPENTIARGITENINPVLATGLLNGTPVPDFPFPLTEDDLRRGEGLFDDVCAPCHGRTAEGNGVVVQRGFITPPSLTAPNIAAMPAGQLFGFVTNGFGAMPSYGEILQPTDRWRVVGYLRALQLSQSGTIDDVPPDQRNQIQPAGGQQ